MAKIKVLVVDDAVVVRRILTDALGADPQLEVTTAANGRIALSKLALFNPDIVTLDIEMPELDGLETLRELRKTNKKLPVIMFSTLTERGASATLDALSAGANDYVTKPANIGSVSTAIARIKTELIPRIKALCGVPETKSVPAPAPPSPAPAVAYPPTAAEPIEVVAIGISTGGPNALSTMLPLLPASLPVPVVIVQHMPPIFTKLLADRLDAQCEIDVKEGAAGMELRPGMALIAAGGTHMVVQRQGLRVVAQTTLDAPENSCRPAVDVLFRSVAAAYKSRVLAVVMTGMGNDGLVGCRLMRQAGAQVIVQDEKSSVVWGMPGFVAREGLAHRILPLGEIAQEIVRRVELNRASKPLAAAV
ncbi:MAG: chemotaxis response regulator protein-glutamate methylesterase [Planctomycetota bacterium]|nr:chemotaxis response regulator protein-glutamate methylesterase [Planctomycetota bacterium]